MAIYLNGTLIAQINKVFFNGTQLSSTGKVYGNGTQVWTGGTLTLMEQVFNASGTFTMPSGVVNNQVIVCCTGGGGGGISISEVGEGSAAGSGRVVTPLTMSTGATATVTIGAGGVGKTSIMGGDIGNSGGTSSFSGATSCGGGGGGRYDRVVPGTSGGGSNRGGASSVPAALSLSSGAVDATTGLWTAKSFSGGASYGGGGGCYGVGSNGITYVQPNSGAGGMSERSGGSGKVVVYYYKYV